MNDTTYISMFKVKHAFNLTPDQCNKIIEKCQYSNVYPNILWDKLLSNYNKHIEIYKKEYGINFLADYPSIKEVNHDNILIYYDKLKIYLYEIIRTLFTTDFFENSFYNFIDDVFDNLYNNINYINIIKNELIKCEEIAKQRCIHNYNSKTYNISIDTYRLMYENKMIYLYSSKEIDILFNDLLFGSLCINYDLLIKHAINSRLPLYNEVKGITKHIIDIESHKLQYKIKNDIKEDVYLEKIKNKDDTETIILYKNFSKIDDAERAATIMHNYGVSDYIIVEYLLNHLQCEKTNTGQIIGVLTGKSSEKSASIKRVNKIKNDFKKNLDYYKKNKIELFIFQDEYKYK